MRYKQLIGNTKKIFTFADNPRALSDIINENDYDDEISPYWLTFFIFN